MAMAESQGEHRRFIERHHVESNSRKEIHGQWMAFGVALVAISGGVFLISQGRDVMGLSAIVTALAALAVVFMSGKYVQHERQKALQREKRLTQPPGGGGEGVVPTAPPPPTPPKKRDR